MVASSSENGTNIRLPPSPRSGSVKLVANDGSEVVFTIVPKSEKSCWSKNLAFGMALLTIYSHTPTCENIKNDEPPMSANDTLSYAAAARNSYDNMVRTLTEQHPRTKPETLQARALEQTAKYAERLHRQRALTIAQTEMACAYNYGADEGIRQAQADYLIGKSVKKWCTSGDEGFCEEAVTHFDG